MPSFLRAVRIARRTVYWIALLCVGNVVAAQTAPPFNSLTFRNIGPASIGGRIHDVEALLWAT